MTTTESILAELAQERDAHAAAGRAVEVARVEQEIIAHRTLARLRADRARYAASGNLAAAAAVDTQIRYWRSMVTAEAGEQAQKPTRSRRGRA